LTGIDRSIKLDGWFEEPGAYVLVDGQFGSTGKGLMAGWLAEYAGHRITHVTTNAGPNSGHTAYFDGHKVMTQQLPVASVFLSRLGHQPYTFLNAGAVIDEAILNNEISGYLPGLSNRHRIMIHPAAALITKQNRADDEKVVGSVAGTGKGIGPAMADKVMRNGGLAGDLYRPMIPVGYPVHLDWDRPWDWNKDVVFVETAQGFSLGVNTARFAPHTTSRECTVMQAISDARIPPSRVKKTVACFRTYPIRVGNTATGYSGNCYEDQRELTWEELGLEPELTTVTKRVRRVFSWSRIQFRHCIAANEPDVVFLNFMNYLSEEDQDDLLWRVRKDYEIVLGRRPQAVLGGFGPLSSDIRMLYQ
jgi:adenylosuccinate synthase